ncbi:TlpA family protein disulfide reductase [Nocardia sp. NPDC052316]|uniref:TlpA family protein disulfide reductase n=1 Tax=Nocardia sp. NPDC052316 TaxID=3364329 RepID=UPI0037CB83E1
MPANAIGLFGRLLVHIVSPFSESSLIGWLPGGEWIIRAVASSTKVSGAAKTRIIAAKVARPGSAGIRMVCPPRADRRSMMVRVGWKISLLLAAAVLLTGCSGSQDNTSSSTVPGSSVTSTSGASPPEPLRFSAPTVDGGEVHGASLVGKPVVLWFWTPSCPTCRREAAGVAEAARGNPDVRFVGVAGGDQLPAMRDFVAKYGLPFPNIADLDGAVWQRFEVTAVPSFVSISKYTEADTVPGTLSEPELAARIATLF